jgi:tetratricopeptide (TPR) repeat protein
MKKAQKNQELKPITGWLQYRIEILLALCSFIAYYPVLSNAFIDWDDLKYITENPITRDLSFQGILNMFSQPVMGNYHPLTMLSLAINFAISGASPMGYHLTNILLHILNVVLVLQVLRRLGLSEMAAVAGAALFGLHPLHVESVAWAAERKDVLYTAFALLAWIGFLKFRSDESKPKYLIHALLFFVAACLSKGMAVTLPVLLLAGEILTNRHKPLVSWMKFFIPFVLTSLIFGAIAVWAQRVQGGMRMDYDIDFITRCVIAAKGYFFYLYTTWVPIGLSAIYPYPADVSALPVSWYLQALAGIAIFLVGAVMAFKNRIIAFVWLGYSGVIFPVLQLLPVGDAVAADRYFYLASIPVFAGIGYLLQMLHTRIGNQVKLPAFALAAALMVLTWLQSARWKDELTLFGHSVNHYPEAAVAWNNMGAILQRQQRFPEAIEMYEKAIAIRPKYTTALCNVGISYGRTGDMEKAVIMLERSIASDSTHAESYGNLGNAYVMQGKRIEALRLFEKAVKLNPKYVESWFNLGIYYREDKNPVLAAQHFRKAIEFRPQFHEAWWSLSAVLFEMNDRKAAIDAARKAASYGNAQAAEWIRANQLDQRIF